MAGYLVISNNFNINKYNWGFHNLLMKQYKFQLILKKYKMIMHKQSQESSEEI